jgi:hypothetical protein
MKTKTSCLKRNASPSASKRESLQATRCQWLKTDRRALAHGDRVDPLRWHAFLDAHGV